MKPLILCIETATKVCSVGIYRGEEEVVLKEEHSEQYIHSEKLAIFIDECIKEANIEPRNLSAVAVSSGPGSYTGLRIGTSTAKGFCFGIDAPLIAIETLDSLASVALSSFSEYDYYLPMIDARRLEVFTSVYTSKGIKIKNTFAEVVESSSFSELLGSKVLCFGDGAEKCLDVLSKLSPSFEDIHCSARNMAKLALEKYHAKEFVDLAYFEPFYLKDFIAGKPKKLL